MRGMHRTRYRRGGVELKALLSTSTCPPMQKLSDLALVRFSGGFITWGWFILTPFSAPSPSHKTEEQNWHFQTYNHGLVFPMTRPHPDAVQEPIQNSFITKKGIPDTQKFTGVLGALCQQQEAETYIQSHAKPYPLFFYLLCFYVTVNIIYTVHPLSNYCSHNFF